MIIGFILSLTIIVLIMPSYIRFLKGKNINQVASEYALDEYKNKEKTPIMGGLLFVIIPLLSYLIINFNNILDRKVLFIIFSFLLFCIVGFIDDVLIILNGKNDGLSPITRLLMEFVISIVLYFIFKDLIPLQITLPILNYRISIPMILFIPFISLFYAGEANAVNFTDGMDGLCAGVSFIALLPIIVLLIIVKQYNTALLLICIEGGIIGYLFFNHHPAKIFMGDSGSLALGALFASIAIAYDLTIIVLIIGGVFVCEMFCVCLQQVSVRLLHKKVFSYTPIHYAFVIKGYKETNIVYCFYLISFVFSIIGLLIGIYTI